MTQIKLSQDKQLNYDLNNLIINLDLEEIQSMIYYCKNNKLDEQKYIYEKITPVLPQDIAGGFIFEGLLDNNKEINKIKDIYFNNIEKYNNIKEFIKKLKTTDIKFSIVYTFSNLSEQFNDVDDSVKDKMESSIKCENNLETIILKDFYNDNDQEILVIKVQENSVENIIYLKTFITAFEEYYKLSNGGEYDKKKIIFTIHIVRQFFSSNEKKSKKIKNKINTISYTSKDVQHLFIDNLNGQDLTLSDINKSNFNDFINKNLKLNKEFCNIAIDYFEDHIKYNISEAKGINSENFVEKMSKYLEENEEIIEKLNEIIIKRIQVGNVLKKMYEDNYVKNNSIDIVSTLTKYMLNIYKTYASELLEIIENNYYLTTLMMINSDDESHIKRKSSEGSEKGDNEEEEIKTYEKDQGNSDEVGLVVKRGYGK